MWNRGCPWSRWRATRCVGYAGYALGLYALGDASSLIFAVLGAAFVIVSYRLYFRFRTSI